MVTFGTRCWNTDFGATQSEVLDLEEGSDYYCAFATYTEAVAFSRSTEGAEAPLSLVRQCEYIAHLNPLPAIRQYALPLRDGTRQISSPPSTNAKYDPDFLSPNAPADRLEILRDLANPK